MAFVQKTICEIIRRLKQQKTHSTHCDTNGNIAQVLKKRVDPSEKWQRERHNMHFWDSQYRMKKMPNIREPKFFGNIPDIIQSRNPKTDLIK
jgi:hypothetical protein